MGPTAQARNLCAVDFPQAGVGTASTNSWLTLGVGKAAKSAEAYAKKSEINEGGQKVVGVSQEGIKNEEGTRIT